MICVYDDVHCVMVKLAVGAGTSGAVFASRLTEDSERTVLLLEAGGDPFDDQNVNIPILADSVRGTEYDWQYHTLPQQQACLGHVNNVCRTYLYSTLPVLMT